MRRTRSATSKVRFGRRATRAASAIAASRSCGPEHAAALNAAMTPQDDEIARARAMVEAFEAARARGEDRALVDGLWVEVPTWRNAKRLLERALRLASVPAADVNSGI